MTENGAIRVPPRGQIQKTQEDKEASMDPGAWGTDSKTSGGIPLFGEGKAHCLPQKRGFRCFLLHCGKDPQIPQDPGSFERRKEAEEGYHCKESSQEPETPYPEKTSRLRGNISPAISSPSIPQESSPSWKGV